MALKTSHKWIIAVGAIIALALAAWFLYKSLPSQQTQGAPPVDTTTTNPGLAQAIAGFFGGGWGGIKNLFGGGKPYQTAYCDPANPGYNSDGLYDNNCQ